jgi:hypothetical protein
MRLGQALRYAPGAIIFSCPEGPARMNKEELKICVHFPTHQQTCRFNWHILSFFIGTPNFLLAGLLSRSFPALAHVLGS